MPDLKVANPIRDLAILERARKEAEALVKADPMLHRPEHAALREAVKSRLGDQFGFILVS